MGTLGLYGILSMVLGMLGMIVMLKGKRPTYLSEPDLVIGESKIVGS